MGQVKQRMVPRRGIRSAARLPVPPSNLPETLSALRGSYGHSVGCAVGRWQAMVWQWCVCW